MKPLSIFCLLLALLGCDGPTRFPGVASPTEALYPVPLGAPSRLAWKIAFEPYGVDVDAPAVVADSQGGVAYVQSTGNGVAIGRIGATGLTLWSRLLKGRSFPAALCVTTAGALFVAAASAERPGVLLTALDGTGAALWTKLMPTATYAPGTDSSMLATMVATNQRLFIVTDIVRALPVCRNSGVRP